MYICIYIYIHIYMYIHIHIYIYIYIYMYIYIYIYIHTRITAVFRHISNEHQHGICKIDGVVKENSMLLSIYIYIYMIYRLIWWFILIFRLIKSNNSKISSEHVVFPSYINIVYCILKQVSRRFHIQRQNYQLTGLYIDFMLKNCFTFLHIFVDIYIYIYIYIYVYIWPCLFCICYIVFV